LVLEKEGGRKAGRKESSKKNVFPSFGCSVREESKCNDCVV